MNGAGATYHEQAVIFFGNDGDRFSAAFEDREEALLGLSRCVNLGVTRRKGERNLRLALRTAAAGEGSEGHSPGLRHSR